MGCYLTPHINTTQHRHATILSHILWLRLLLHITTGYGVATGQAGRLLTGGGAARVEERRGLVALLGVAAVFALFGWLLLEVMGSCS